MAGLLRLRFGQWSLMGSRIFSKGHGPTWPVPGDTAAATTFRAFRDNNRLNNTLGYVVKCMFVIDACEYLEYRITGHTIP